eukprot:TRINITY_DN1628_c0_g1_i1.p1 TRINITY_DN1628_c0_g1~~TRINITY_DN1628_c0_g1_i1.p1  ORF type:complete len:302 (-),score=52.47 TRINITY_DN1628_c0_g1_i1:133-1038(-)
MPHSSFLDHCHVRRKIVYKPSCASSQASISLSSQQQPPKPTLLQIYSLRVLQRILIMIAVRNIFTIFTLSFLTLVSASAIVHPNSVIPIVDIQESTLVIPLVRQQEEEVVFAVNSSSTGFARTTEAGLTVQRGTSGVLNFAFTINAIEAETLATMDEEFSSSLSVSEREEYNRLRSDYRGGFGIPFLRFLGINLNNRRVTREEMERSFELREDYNTQSSIAQQIISNVQTQQLQVSGQLTAFGTSFVPTTVFAFIRIARIQTQDGMTLTVVSQSGDNLVAADAGGNTVPSSGGDIDIVPLF